MTRQEKAAQHAVEASALGVFLVKSASSGAVYIVTPVLDGALSSLACNCEWGRRGRAGHCSHVLAVLRFAASVVRRSAASVPEVR